MKTDLSYDDLYRLLQEAYKGMWAENMSCPWCGGYISGRRQEHYKDCDILKVPGIRELIRQLNKERREWEKKRDNLWTQLKKSF